MHLGPAPSQPSAAAAACRTKEVILPNGNKVTVRYNDTCHFYQPPRAHHCSVNDNCIERFDHHCPWVGTTIGLVSACPLPTLLLCTVLPAAGIQRISQLASAGSQDMCCTDCRCRSTASLHLRSTIATQHATLAMLVC